MKTIIKIMLLGVFLFTSKQANAQLTRTKTKILMTNGDEKFGYAKRHRKEIYFYKDRKTKEKEIIPIPEIKKLSYAFSEGYKEYHYLRNSRTGKLRLVLLLIDGDFKLYKTFQSENMSKINNDADKSIVMSTDGKEYVVFKNFKKDARRIFKDCQLVIDGINDRTYSRLDLAEMVIVYNDNCIEVMEDKIKPKEIEKPIVKVVEKPKEVKKPEPIVVEEKTIEIVEPTPVIKKVESVKVIRDKVIVNINPIYFNLDKATLRSDATIELDKVVLLMKKNPLVRIEVGSHTDSRGTKEYNMQLSSQRASETLNYIVRQGIDSKRISARGYGESQLINQCDDNTKCNELEHGINRRTEFVILNPDVMGY